MQGSMTMSGYLAEIWKLRYFWAALVRIDLKNRYRRSIIGLGWSLLHPIAMTTVICVVFSNLLAMPWRTFGPHVLCGLIYWNFITAAMGEGCHCVFQGEPYIRQHPAPLAIYPLRTVLGAGIHLISGLVVVSALAWILNGFNNLPEMITLIPTLIILFIFGWSLAICMGVFNVFFQDCEHLITVLLQILFYMSPIIYTREMLQQRGLDWIININPFAVILEMLRRPICEASLPTMTTCLFGLLTVSFVLVSAILTLRYFERRIIFYL